MKSRRGCRLGLSCYCPPHDHLREQGNERKLLRGESEGCQRACHLCFRTAVLHETHETAASQWICRAPARDVGKAKSYQLIERREKALGEVRPRAVAVCNREQNVRRLRFEVSWNGRLVRKRAAEPDVEELLNGQICAFVSDRIRARLAEPPPSSVRNVSNASRSPIVPESRRDGVPRGNRLRAVAATATRSISKAPSSRPAFARTRASSIRR